MSATTKQAESTDIKLQLLLLCRFLGITISYRVMLFLLSGTGIALTFMRKTHFAPYGIALICLLLPAFINNSSPKTAKKENSDRPLSVLFQRYHYSLSSFTAYRITLSVCMLLLFIWHLIQATPLTLFGASLPLLYLALCLALTTVLGRVLFFFFHHRLMNGSL